MRGRKLYVDDRTMREVFVRLARCEAELAGVLRRPAIPLYATLADAGASGAVGRLVVIAADGRLYRGTGSGWQRQADG